MSEHGSGISRRAWLRGMTAVTAAAAGAASGAGLGGCATLPAVPDVHGVHPCSHIYCRYHELSEGSDGRCSLPLREAGGLP